MISIRVDLNQHAIAEDYLVCVADDHLGRVLSPASGGHDSVIEFGFDDAADAKAFRTAMRCFLREEAA